MISEYQEEMQTAYKELEELRCKLNGLKRKLSIGAVENYQFDNGDNAKVGLADLFGDKKDLIIVQNMGQGCKYCTLWADGFNGIVPHLENRAALALISNDPIYKSLAFAESRNWTFRILSSKDTSFKADLGFTNENHGTSPGLSTFRKKEDGSIEHIANDFFGPGDSYCAQWHMLDLLADGQNGWAPEYSY